MNPIIRMMKRYIKTPLKYALPLLCIGVLVLSVSISGCTSSENAPTETPTTSATLAPALQTVESQLKTTYADPSYNLTVGEENSNLHFRLNDHGVVIDGNIYSYDTIDSANDSIMTSWQTMINEPDTFTPLIAPPHFEMMPIATAALGHTPTTEFYGSFRDVGSSPPIYTDIVQYDTLVVHSDAVTGASASATPSSTTDYSSYFSTGFINPQATLTQPFTKSTNERGDDVYTGVYTSPSSTVTTVIELTKSQADAKQLYQQSAAQKQSEGYTLCSYCVAQFRASNPNTPEFWYGKQSSTGADFSVQYYYDSHVASWPFVTQAGTGP